MKKLKTTKQYEVSGKNTLKPIADVELPAKIITYLENEMRKPSGLRVHDATKDVTEEDKALIRYRRLIEENAMRDYEKRTERKADRKSLIAFIFSMASIAAMALYILIEYKF